MNLKIYEVNDSYIDQLSQIDNRVAHHKQSTRIQTRNYIGILFQINSIDYFANLSSYKPKHDKIPERIDFIKIGKLAVVNVNNMIPVNSNNYKILNINGITDEKYKTLILKEIRIIRTKSKQIIKSAHIIYRHKIDNGENTALARRCCDFRKLESYALQSPIIV